MTDDIKDAAEEIASLVDGAENSPQPPAAGLPENFAGEDDAEFDAPPPEIDEAERKRLDPETIKACAGEPQNDTGNGQRLLKHFGADLLNVREMSGRNEAGWHYWTGQRWRREGGNEFATLCAQRTAPRIHLEANFITATPGEQRAIDDAAQAQADLDALTARGEDKWTEADRKHARRLQAAIDRGAEALAEVEKRQIARRRFAVSSGNGARLREMLNQALPHRTAAIEDIDKDALAFNCANGTLRFEAYDVPDLECPDPDQRRSATLWVARLDPHDPGDLISKLAPVEYHPDATAPIFLQSIERFQPNEAKRRFVQKYLGYCMTGLNGEQCLLFNYGSGANWKSTFIEIVSRVMGEYAAMLKFESIAGESVTTGAQANPDFARLPGTRLVRTTEPDHGMGLKEGLIKSLTSGEPWLTRHNFGNFFSFYPSFKMVISGNHKPDIGGVDHGIWRRIRFVIWPVQIGDAERRDMDDVMAELWAERAGILAWLVEGALLYLNEGLVPPPEIRAETEEYREEMDPVGGFVASCVTRFEIKEGAEPQFVSAQEMYDSFVRWCEANGVRYWKQKAFGQAMSQKGFVKDRRATLRRYLWVALHDVPTRSARREEPPHPSEAVGTDQEIPG